MIGRMHLHYSGADGLKRNSVLPSIANVDCAPDRGYSVTPSLILKTAVKSVGERQRVVSVALCTAPHLTKMVKSSMFATVFALNQLAILTHFACRF